jgi:hypothetical protein
MESQFALDYDVVGSLLGLMGLGPRFAGITVTSQEVEVRMGWAFEARIPRSEIIAVARATAPAGFGGMLVGWGVHTTMGGTWYVNGSHRNLVGIELAHRVRSRATLVPVRVSRLIVSVEDPDGLIAALR